MIKERGSRTKGTPRKGARLAFPFPCPRVSESRTPHPLCSWGFLLLFCFQKQERALECWQ
nr:MAG TPA: hypothetical protein [Caudoviricetes sp.]